MISRQLGTLRRVRGPWGLPNQSNKPIRVSLAFQAGGIRSPGGELAMRLSRWARSTVINASDGRVLGFVGEYDLAIDPVSGRIQGLLRPWRFLGPMRARAIHRDSIRQLLPDTVVVDLSVEHR